MKSFLKDFILLALIIAVIGGNVVAGLGAIFGLTGFAPAAIVAPMVIYGVATVIFSCILCAPFAD